MSETTGKSSSSTGGTSATNAARAAKRQAQAQARMALDHAMVKAWGGIRETEDDGWLMRFSQAYTRRGNAVYPLEDGRYPAQQKVPVVEQLYMKRKLRPMFRMTVDTPPDDLDAFLADNGYARVQRTSVYSHPLDRPVVLRQGQQPDGEELELADGLTDQWLTLTDPWRGFATQEQRPEARRPLMERFRHDPSYLVLLRRNQPVAAGVLCVQSEAEGARAFLFAVAAKPGCPGLDPRLSLVLAAGQQARERGATLICTETPMKDLYGEGLQQSLGFRERYRYWFRAKMFF